MDEDNSSDSEEHIIEDTSSIEDLNTFYKNYEKMKKEYITLTQCTTIRKII